MAKSTTKIGCVHIRRLSASKMQSLVIDRRSHLKITGNVIHMGDPKRPSTAVTVYLRVTNFGKFIF